MLQSHFFFPFAFTIYAACKMITPFGDSVWSGLSNDLPLTMPICSMFFIRVRNVMCNKTEKENVIVEMILWQI